MKSKFRFSVIGIVCIECAIAPVPFTVLAANPALPPGFEDLFESRQSGIFEVIFNDLSIGSLSAEFDRETVLLSSPSVVVEQLTSEGMPQFNISRNALRAKLSSPLKRVGQPEFDNQVIVALINEKDASLHLIFPATYYAAPDEATERTYIVNKTKPGFVHNHNLNFLSDTYGDSFTYASSDTLNLTGNSYIKSAWSYAQEIDFTFDELALYIENERTRFKAGRQRMNDNFVYSTPSLSYSFFNAISFDGVSLGYMTDNYMNAGTGAASQVMLYMPQAGTVEVYRNGKIIDLQQFPAGLQKLNTDSWPMGGYDVQLISKLVNGAREIKTQPFFKRSGIFRSGDLEYSIQMGRYDEGRVRSSSQRRLTCSGCTTDESGYDSGNHNIAGVTAGYTTESALSLGSGVMLDDDYPYLNASMDVPIDSWFAERIYGDGIVSNDKSHGFQVGVSKNLSAIGFNASYRDNRYKGSKKDYQRYGVVPAYDYSYLQFGLSIYLPWNLGLSATYSANTLYQQYGRKDKTKFNSWDIALNRDFTLSDRLNLRVDAGYHQGMNEYQTSRNKSISIDKDRDRRVFIQFTLGAREQSYNHYQSLYLRTKLSDNKSENGSYSADYSLDLQNPAFDRSGHYTVGASASGGAEDQSTGGVSLVVDNALGFTSAGMNSSLGDGSYNQYYLSQRSGFAVGDGQIAYGKTDSGSALIIDARDLPGDQYFEVRNRNSETVLVKGGSKTTLSMQPYQKISPSVEQVYTGETDAFYNLMTRTTSTWVMPGQVYNVKLSATKNLTVTGRLYHQRVPLKNARVVGGNTLTDENGFFVGDFTLDIVSKLRTLNVKSGNKNYICPLKESKVRLNQGVMQISEVECKVQ